MTARLEIWGVTGLPEVNAGDDIATLLMRCPGFDVQTGDVLVITSKIVSKAQGRLVPGTRADHLDAETRRVVAQRGETTIVETHDGFVMAAAGIDASNVPAGTVALLPTDPDRAATEIRDALRAATGVEVAVIISDTMGRPWRDGIVDNAIGAAGLDVLWDLRGQRDDAGHLLEATVVAVADELAAAADLVKGKLAATPVAVVRGFPFVRSNLAERGARPLIRSSDEDMFRLGTREAMRQAVVDAQPVAVPGDATDGRRVDAAAVSRAVGLVGTGPVQLVISADGRVVSASGEALNVGIALGRLSVALAAEGLRCSAPEPTADGAVLRIRAAD